MGIENTWLLARESVYWINMNANIEHMVKQVCFILEEPVNTAPRKVLHYEIPCILWEVVGADASHT